MTNWTDDLVRLGACEPAVEWARTQPDLETAWSVCDRGDWMLWLLGKLSGEPGSASRKKLVLCSCDCAELFPRPMGDRYRKVIDHCLATARSWARDEGASLDDVKRADRATAAYDVAYDVAYAAYTAAYVAAYVAYAAAYVASNVAAYVAHAVANAADIVRRHYPEPPRIGAKEERSCARESCPECTGTLGHHDDNCPVQS